MDRYTFDFIVGLSIGLEIELGNSSECIRRGTLTLREFAEAFTYLEQGIEHLNLNDLERGGEALGTALATIPDLMKDCGVVKLEQDIKHVVELIKNGVLKFLVKETVVIVVHGREINNDVRTMLVNYRLGKYRESGTALGKILGLLLKV